ncbi:MAG: hypothetical protein K1Y02_03750 [Candidatus Hydrogenedentes bacterium]|nr:hypothetical protein [Candidatus Hydrogenedentota bacterium]
MPNPYGRFTVCGSSAVEELLTALATDAARMAEAALSPSEYRALVIIGGYGRGEGGVEIVSGQERPHNNIDFLLIAETSRPAKIAALRHRLLEAFQPVMQQYDLEIDLSVIGIWQLRFSPTLIIWYETRFGHKTILGDTNFVPSLSQFRLDRIPCRDALRLLVNRGTLLVINDQLLDKNTDPSSQKRRITRNIMKAIIGYGDALLFVLGDYDWSYVERKRRMKLRHELPPEFRQWYDRAAEFRFCPNYEYYDSWDLASWMENLRDILEPIHRQCEEKRLGLDHLAWEEYPAHASAHALLDEPMSIRAWARKSANFCKKAQCPQDLGIRGRMGYRALGVRGRYPIVFPAIAYRMKEARLREFAAKVLNSDDTTYKALREAYLRFWCEEVDINAYSSLRIWQPPNFQENGV